MNCQAPQRLSPPQLVADVFAILLRVTPQTWVVHPRASSCSVVSTRSASCRLPAGGQLLFAARSAFFWVPYRLARTHITRLLQRYVRAGARCVDVGANIGYFTIMLAQLAGENGLVTAYEPVPENFAVLRLNADLANQDNARITAVNAAVSDDHEPVRILRKAESTLHQVEKTSARLGSMVRAVTLDAETYRWGESCDIDVLKIDVEGYERAVIDGARNLLSSRKIRHLVVEVTPGEKRRRFGPASSSSSR